MPRHYTDEEKAKQSHRMKEMWKARRGELCRKVKKARRLWVRRQIRAGVIKPKPYHSVVQPSLSTGVPRDIIVIAEEMIKVRNQLKALTAEMQRALSHP